MWPARSQFPDQGLNPGPLQWKLRVLTTGPPGKSLPPGFFNKYDRHKSMALGVLPYSNSLSSFPRSNHYPKFGIHHPYMHFYMNIYYSTCKCVDKQCAVLVLNCKKWHCTVCILQFCHAKFNVALVDITPRCPGSLVFHCYIINTVCSYDDLFLQSSLLSSFCCH